ncbi:MAG: hypothetical protein GY705_18245 [Bacteroidetes bacterium]|nr:hypothetical protein [Bacteroidota bacterium]
MSVFDKVGREVMVLMDKTYPEGKHQVKFNSRRLPPWNYYYRLIKSSGSYTGSMVKL